MRNEQVSPTGERHGRDWGDHPTYSTDDPPNKRRRSGAPRNCAECRRLKLRCDKVFPCVSCVKRGLSAICPDGCLTTGQGNRFILASTEELHERIAVLTQRIRTLEDALRDAQDKLASSPHPLLSDELLAIKAPLQRDVPSGAPSTNVTEVATPETQDALVEALGSLSIRDNGSVNYFGQTANSWYLLQNEETNDTHPSGAKSHIPSYVHPHLVENPGAFLLSLFPSGLGNINDEGCRQILGSLPPPNIAKHLRGVYFERAAWHYSPIKLDQFNEDIFQYFYEREFSYATTDYALFQRVAILFLVFAIGSAMDPASEMYNEGAERYHQLALASLFHGRPIERPTLHGVQALFLTFTYSYFVDRHASCEEPSRWTLLGMVVRLAYAIGLHRDSSKFGLPEREVQLRRTLLCEIRYTDSWQAFSTGRPPGMSGTYIDATPPVIGPATDLDQAWLSCKHRWLTECLSVVQDEAYGSKPPTHAQVMRLDRIIRSFVLPLEYTKPSQAAIDGHSIPEYTKTIPFILRRGSMTAGREITYMYLHRSFFFQAINDRPDDPASGPYGSSFLACYRAAVNAMQVCKEIQAGPAKETMSRIWFWWSHLSSNAVVFATLISKSPSNSLAPSALEHLDTCVDLLKPIARHFHAEKPCGMLIALRDRAHRALNAFRTAPGLASPVVDDDDESVAALGGRTRVVSPRSSRPRSEVGEAALHEMRALLGLNTPVAPASSAASSSSGSSQQSPSLAQAATGVWHHGHDAYEPHTQVSPPIQPWLSGTTHLDLSSYPSTTPWTGSESWLFGGETLPPMASQTTIPQSAARNEQPEWPAYGFL